MKFLTLSMISFIQKTTAIINGDMALSPECSHSLASINTKFDKSIYNMDFSELDYSENLELINEFENYIMMKYEACDCNFLKENFFLLATDNGMKARDIFIEIAENIREEFESNIENFNIILDSAIYDHFFPSASFEDHRWTHRGQHHNDGIFLFNFNRMILLNRKGFSNTKTLLLKYRELIFKTLIKHFLPYYEVFAPVENEFWVVLGAFELFKVLDSSLSEQLNKEKSFKYIKALNNIFLSYYSNVVRIFSHYKENLASSLLVSSSKDHKTDCVRNILYKNFMAGLKNLVIDKMKGNKASEYDCFEESMFPIYASSEGREKIRNYEFKNWIYNSINRLSTILDGSMNTSKIEFIHGNDIQMNSNTEFFTDFSLNYYGNTFLLIRVSANDTLDCNNDKFLSNIGLSESSPIILIFYEYPNHDFSPSEGSFWILVEKN